MGGKSRKSGKVSKGLIDRLKKMKVGKTKRKKAPAKKRVGAFED